MTSAARDLRHALDPAAFCAEQLGLAPDAWQAHVLRSSARRMLMLCTRQAGKSTAAAVLALHPALYYPGALTLVVSPTLRQSSELFRKVLDMLARLPERPDLAEESKLSLRLSIGSRIVSLPSSLDFSGLEGVVEHAARRPRGTADVGGSRDSHDAA